MGIASRITNTGILYVNGIFDEVTYSSTSPVIKNLYTYTEQFNNVYWSLTNGATVVADAIVSPIGTMTADKIQETSGTSFWGVATNPPALFSTTYTCSIYAKAAEINQMTISFSVVPNSTSIFTLTGAGTVSPGSATTCTITSVDNGWYRCTCTFTTASSGSNLLYNVLLTGVGTHTGTAGYGVYFWGAQLEIGSSATTYQGIAAAGTLVAPGFSTRATSNTMYVTSIFDEVSGMIDTDGLLLYVNGSSSVYSGSGTQWLDISSYKNNATLTNSPTYNVSTGGGSFAFNGSTQYAAINTALLNTTYTGKTVFFVGRLNASAWTPGVNQFRAMFGNAGVSRNFNFYVHQSAANVVDFHYSTSGSAFFTGAVSLGTNWFVAAVTQDATTTKVYLNGTEIYSVAGQTLSQYANGGEEAVAKADNYFYGDVAACAVYSRGLSAAEILNNYNAFAARVGLTPTVNTPSNRNTSNGTMYVTNSYDEFTGAPVVDSSLQLWLDAGQTASYSGTGSTWTDLSSAGNNGTLVGSPTYTSSNGGGLVFDTSKYVTLASAIALTGDFTISWWGYLTGTISNNQGIIYSGVTGNDINYYQGFVRLYSPTNGNQGISPTSTAANTWYNWAYVRSGTTLTLYLNGSSNTSGTVSVYTVNIAQIARGVVGSMTGTLPVMQIYNRALSAAEVATNFNALSRRYGL